MSISFLAWHTPFIRDREVPPTPVPTPVDPETQPQPPATDAIAFNAIIVPEVSVATATSYNMTLANVTCADTAMTVQPSEPIPGMTFAYSAGVMSMNGTPTTPRKHRIQVLYLASDGSGRIRGATEHVVKVYKTAETLAIGLRHNPLGKVGVPMDELLLEPQISADALITYRLLYGAPIPGVELQWTWTRGDPTSSGEMRVVGTPQTAGGYALQFEFFRDGLSIGTSSHQVYIHPPYETIPSAPAPSPAPSPSPPVPPPTAAPTPSPSAQGPDSLWSSVSMLLPFNIEGDAELVDDVAGSHVLNNNGVGTSLVGLTGSAASFGPLSSFLNTSTTEAKMSTEALTVECFIKPTRAAWDSLNSATLDQRLMPILSLQNADTGKVVWSLGLMSYISSMGLRRVLGYFYFVSQQVQYAEIVQPFALSTNFVGGWSDRYLHLAGGRRRILVTTPGQLSPFQVGAWLDGKGGFATLDAGATVDRLRFNNGSLVIGAPFAKSRMYRDDLNGNTSTLLAFAGELDEVRVTKAARYATYMGDNSTTDIPTALRTGPWPQY